MFLIRKGFKKKSPAECGLFFAEIDPDDLKSKPTRLPKNFVSSDDRVCYRKSTSNYDITITYKNFLSLFFFHIILAKADTSKFSQFHRHDIFCHLYKNIKSITWMLEIFLKISTFRVGKLWIAEIVHWFTIAFCLIRSD